MMIVSVVLTIASQVGGIVVVTMIEVGSGPSAAAIAAFNSIQSAT